MVDRHLYRCPSCGQVTRAHPTRAGFMRCASCGRTLRASEHMMRPDRPYADGEREGRVFVRQRRDERALASLSGMRYRARHFRDMLDRQLGRSPLGQMEEMRNERFERFARYLVRGA